MKKFKTEQEDFWAGKFGNEYIKRNFSPEIISSNLRLFSQMLAHAHNVSSVLEVGANVGQNLIALKQLLPRTEFNALEINRIACVELKKYRWVRQVINESILNYKVDRRYDLVITKGVLIHIDPRSIDSVYDKLYALSSRYLCIAEYYNPTPVEVNYRGHSGRLFKRDYAGDLLQKYDSLTLVNYGFSYHLDPNFPHDDINWFLLEKR